MNIINFTPVPATIGGMIIGLAVVIFFLFNGRLIGISGIAANALSEKNNRFDNLLFLIGLVIGPILYTLFTNKEINITISPMKNMDIGAGRGQELKTVIYGGTVGVIFDGRDRPITIPKETNERLEALNKWSNAINEYPEI